MFFLRKIQEQAEFEEAILEYLDALYGTALRLTGQVVEAEDLVQDTYMRAVRFRKRFEPGTNLKAWLFKMMVNLFINKYRAHRRLRKLQETMDPRELAEKFVPREQLLSTCAPEEYFFEKLFSDDVVKALDALPQDFKMVVLLADVNGFSYAHIADMLEIPMGTVMSRLHRGRKVLRESLYSFAVEEGYIREKDSASKPSNVLNYLEKKKKMESS